MKKFVIILTMLTTSLIINAQNYNKLWREFDKNIENFLPESAEKTLDIIEKQALKDNNDVQLLKTIIKKSKIFYMKEENPRDTIVKYCKSCLPKLSEASQVILNVETAKITNENDEILEYKDNDFIKTVSIKDYTDVFLSKNDNNNFDVELEPTLYDYVMHYLIDNYHLNDIENELYDKLLAFDLENNYSKAYYNNVLKRIGNIYNDEIFEKYSQLATECTDSDLVAKIRGEQIQYLANKKEYVEAKKMCEETMASLKNTHPVYKQCKAFVESLTKKSVEVKLNNVYVARSSIPVGLTYRNTTNPTYRIYKVSTNEYYYISELDKKNTLYTLLKKKPVVENTVKLPAETDYCKHSTLIALPALQYGIYYIVFSKTDSFKDSNDLIFTSFQISDLAFFNLETDECTDLYVVNRNTGEPMKNVEAHFSKREYSFMTDSYVHRYIKKAVSDENGFIAVPITDNNNYLIDLYNDGDTLISTMYFDFYRQKENSNLNINSKIFTDRAIYRPGQTVQFSCVVYRGNSKTKEVMPNYETTLRFVDPNYQPIDTLHLTTNEYGAVSGSFTIPSDRINGSYRIYEDHGSTRVRVEEYKRPTFEITFESPETEYKIGDSVTVNGKVSALSGFGLDNVAYSYQIVRKTAFPFRFWNWIPYYVEDEIISSGENTTSPDGSFNIGFLLKPSYDVPVIDIPQYTYEIQVTATNKQGETQSDSFRIVAFYNKYNISLSNNDTNIDVNDLNNLMVNATNINGNPVNTKVEYKIFRINDIDRYPKELGDFDRKIMNDALLKAYFPKFDYYSQEDVTKDLVYQGVLDVDGQARLLNDKKLLPAKYVIELRSVNDTLSAFSGKYTVFDLKSKKMPFKTMLWKNIDKTTARPGETINYYIGSSENNMSALVMVKRGKTILKMERITLNNNIYKFSYKVREEDRGRLDFQVATVRYNTEIRHIDYVDVPFDNMKLNVVLNTERNKLLPGSEETWSVTVKDYKDNPAKVPIIAVMYDAALDNFCTLDWYFNTLPTIPANSIIMSDRSFDTHIISQYHYIPGFHNEGSSVYSKINLLSNRYFGLMSKERDQPVCAKLERLDISSLPIAVKDNISTQALKEDFAEAATTGETTSQEAKPAKIRKDFNETAFFYPDLKTDKNGNATFTFTMPDALTKWNLKLLAYSKTLSVGNFDRSIVTQQPLMIMADMPRFVYDEDTLLIAANVINLSEDAVSPIVKLETFDGANNPIELILSDNNINISIEPGRSQKVIWKVAMQKDVSPLVFRFSANNDGFSDAEQHLLPVLSTDIFMTQTYSLTTEAHTKKEYEFNINNESERNHDIKLDFNDNPVFYAIQALPYLAESDEKYSASAFYRYFINKMAQEIIAGNPNIKEMLKGHEDDTLSELQKNEDLKNILLKETPWVTEARNEARQRANISKLFDNEAIDKNIASALNLLEKKQTINGGWPWINDMPESEYITQDILCGLGRLGNDDLMTKKAFNFLGNKIVKRYNTLDTQKKKNDAVCDFMTMKDLYAMSFFSYDTSDQLDKAKNFYIKKLHSDWKRYELEDQAYIALILNRNSNSETARLIIRSLRERAIKNNLGMYWRYIDVKSEARILEAFNEIDPKTSEIDAMRLWILTQKRTNMWENEQSSVEAIFSIMDRGTDWTSENASATMTVGTDSVKAVIDNKSNHVVWGGLYRQYFVPIDKIKKHNDEIKVKREIITPKNVKVGDKVEVIITIENNRDMEFVYLKDWRGACFEPEEQLSRYHWKNGLRYYQSTGDVATEYFFDYLPKGKHTISYYMYVTKEGSFSAGYSQIQCQYAPEFGAYSNGGRISVNP